MKRLDFIMALVRTAAALAVLIVIVVERVL